jgi:hypothetical protein
LAQVQLGKNIANYASSLPNKSHVEIANNLGYASEKVIESVLISKGASLASTTL